MHDLYLLLLLVLSSNAVRSSIISNAKENGRSIQKASRAEAEDTSIPRGLKNFQQDKNHDLQDKNQDVETPKKDIPRDNIPFTKMPGLTTREHKSIGRSLFHLDPVFDSLNNRRLWQKRKKKEHSSSSSSEIEMRFWLKDWEEQRQIDLIEALNSTQGKKKVLVPNMKMARPSGIPCGDPYEHDFPWGNCLPPAECEEEFRIHRGDLSCGRSWYVCCAFVDTTYDMYQAQAMSFEHDNSLTTDSDIDNGYRDTHEQKKRDRLQRKHEKNKRKRTKRLLKKKIRHSITKIITEITKMLQKAYRNSTSLRISKAKALMDFIKQMKKQYRKDRQRLVDAHEFDILKYDREMEVSLIKIQGVNEAYMNNATFRDIVTNGTVNEKELHKLQRQHPVLSLFFKSRRMDGDFEPEQTGKEEPESEKEELDLDNEEPRLEKEESDLEIEEPWLEKEELDLENEESQLEKERSESEEDEPKPRKEKTKDVDYDVEYGVLYY